MEQKQFPRFLIDDIPEYQKLKAANPQNPNLTSLQAIVMYGRAIHWVGIFDVIWPDFDKIERYFKIELGYIVINDPDDSILPPSFYEYLRNMIVMFWEMQLRTRYPHGDWSIAIDDDPEMTIELEIRSRS
jgi:hypothetical protein